MEYSNLCSIFPIFIDIVVNLNVSGNVDFWLFGISVSFVDSSTCHVDCSNAIMLHVAGSYFAQEKF
jgi:hypothetical protein